MTTFSPIATFTRPADVTPYTIGDLMASTTVNTTAQSFRFDMGGLRGSTGLKLRSVSLKKSTNVATLATFLMHLFNVSKTLTNGDNGAFNVPDMVGYFGSVALDMATGGSTGFTTAAELFKQFGVASPELYSDVVSGTLFGYLVASAAYVPGSAEIFTAQLGLESV